MIFRKERESGRKRSVSKAYLTLLCKSEHDEDDENQERALTVSFLPSCFVLFDGVDDGVMRKREDRADPSLEACVLCMEERISKEKHKEEPEKENKWLNRER